MKSVFLLFFLIFSCSFGAVRTVSVGGGNWATASTWVEVATPAAGDSVTTLGNTSGPLTINTTTCVCASANFTGYTNTVNFITGDKLTVSGGITFVSGMTLMGPGNLTVNATATLLSGGKTIPGSFTLSGANTYTMGDSWTVSGPATLQGTINSNSITCLGGTKSGGAIGGTSFIALAGGTVLLPNAITCPVSITGNITWSGPQTLNNVTSWVSGTMTNSAAYLGPSAACTYNFGAGVFPGAFAPTGSPTITLTGPLSISGAMTLVAADNLTFLGANPFTIGTIDSTSSSSMVYPAGQTITVTTAFISGGSNANQFALSSGTPSSTMYLNFTGLLSGDKCFFSNFTDVTALGAPFLNYFGANPYGALLRTVNIKNQNLPASGGFIF